MIKNWILNENFEKTPLSDSLEWYNEPKKWSVDNSRSKLVLATDEGTDFWQKTHYGFQVDNGHFLYTKTNKNFRMTTKVKTTPKSRYDQAGLMIRFSADTWVKTSIEYIPSGPSKLGAVVTNGGYSDWSTQYVDRIEIPLYYRISRIAKNCYVDFSLDGKAWNQIRIAHIDIPEISTIQAGIYACSPQGKEQEVHFEFLTIEELSNNPNEAYL